MKTLNTALLLILFSTFILSSCKDEEPEPTPEPTKTELLTAHPWLITDVKNNGTSIYNSFAECIRDNSFTFYGDGNGITDEEAMKCNGADPQYYVFRWLFSNNQTKLVWKNPNSTDTFDIESIT